MRQLVRHIPNFITSLNLVSGSLAVIFAIDGHLTWAGIFICLAAVLDFLDGVTARLLNAYSDIGKELDSLADMISFGLAPGAILFTLLELSLFGENQTLWSISAQWYIWIILLSSLILPVLSALRLARFNVMQSDETYFSGLPTPANGLFWASLGILLEIPKYSELHRLLYSTHMLLILGLFTSGMLVISMPMFSLKFKNLKLKENWYRYLFLILAVVFLSVFHIYGLAATIFLYIILNIVFYLIGIRY